MKKIWKEEPFFSSGCIVGLFYLLFEVVNNNLTQNSIGIIYNEKLWSFDTIEELSILLKDILGPHVLKGFVSLIILAALSIIVGKLDDRFRITKNLILFLLGLVGTVVILGLVVPTMLMVLPVIIGLAWILAGLMTYLLKGIFIIGFQVVAISIVRIQDLSINYETRLDILETFLFFQFIIFATILPYCYRVLLRLVIKFVRSIAKLKSEPFLIRILKMVSVEKIRMIMYLYLFLLYMMLNIWELNDVFIIIRESLLAYVLIDTFTYYVYKSIKNKIRSGRKAKLEVLLEDIRVSLNLIIFYDLISQNTELKIKLKLPNHNKIECLRNEFASEGLYFRVEENLNEITSEFYEPKLIYKKLMKVQEDLKLYCG